MQPTSSFWADAAASCVRSGRCRRASASRSITAFLHLCSVSERSTLEKKQALNVARGTTASETRVCDIRLFLEASEVQVLNEWTSTYIQWINTYVFVHVPTVSWWDSRNVTKQKIQTPSELINDFPNPFRLKEPKVCSSWGNIPRNSVFTDHKVQSLFLHNKMMWNKWLVIHEVWKNKWPLCLLLILN